MIYRNLFLSPEERRVATVCKQIYVPTVRVKPHTLPLSVNPPAALCVCLFSRPQIKKDDNKNSFSYFLLHPASVTPWLWGRRRRDEERGGLNVIRVRQEEQRRNKRGGGERILILILVIAPPQYRTLFPGFYTNKQTIALNVVLTFLGFRGDGSLFRSGWRWQVGAHVSWSTPTRRRSGSCFTSVLFLAALVGFQLEGGLLSAGLMKHLPDWLLWSAVQLHTTCRQHVTKSFSRTANCAVTMKVWPKWWPQATGSKLLKWKEQKQKHTRMVCSVSLCLQSC